MRTTLSQHCHTQEHSDCPGQYHVPRRGITAGVLYIDQRQPPEGESLFLAKAKCICTCHTTPAITSG